MSKLLEGSVVNQTEETTIVLFFHQGKQFLFDLSFLVHIKPGNSTVTGIAKQQYYLDIEQTVLDIDLKLTMLMVIKSCSTR